MMRSERGSSGIPVDNTTCEQLIAAARQVGIERHLAEDLMSS
jgi:hypothetical protein